MLADTAHLFLLDDSGLVFSETAQNVYALNTAAALAWCLLEEGESRPRIEAELARVCELSPSVAHDTLSALFNQWRELGLLHDERIVSSGYYRLLDTLVRVRFSDPEQLARVHPVLAHLETAVSDGDSPDVIFDVVKEPDGTLRLRRDTGETWDCRNLDYLAPLLKGRVLQAAINNSRYFLYLHAGVVVNEQRALILPAAAGSGKTTLTAALIHAGLGYFSDEVALLDDALQVQPVPLSFCVKTPGVAVLRPYYPILDTLTLHQREDGKSVYYVPPPASPSTGSTVPVGLIVFPRYDPSAGPETLIPLNRVTALQRLFSECMAMPQRLSVIKVQKLVNWIERTPCFELPFSSLDNAVTLLTNALRQPQ